MLCKIAYMILIADGGSTKVDWVVLDNKFIEIDKVRTEGLNPAVVDEQVLTDRLVSSEGISQISKKVNQIYFYGAGCGTTHAILQLEKVFKSFFSNAQHITIGEDMLGAAYAASPNKESVVCILGTGSNSCFFDGKCAK